VTGNIRLRCRTTYRPCDIAHTNAHAGNFEKHVRYVTTTARALDFGVVANAEGAPWPFIVESFCNSPQA
jgi:hypothetical protein